MNGSRRYLISLRRKAVLLVESQSGSSTRTPSPQSFGRRRGMVFSPEFTQAKEISLWREVFGPDIEDRRVLPSDPPGSLPWSAVGGGWKPGWQGWVCVGAGRPSSKHWRQWPPEGGDLAILALAEGTDTTSTPPTLGDDSP